MKDTIIIEQQGNIMIHITIQVKTIVPVLVTLNGFMIDGKGFTDKTLDIIDCGLGVVLDIDNGHRFKDWFGC